MSKVDKIQVLEKSLIKGFIDNRQEGSMYDSRLVINNPEQKKFVINDILNELVSAQSFFFSVAFITQAGLNELKTVLADLAREGKRGRLLTSNYLSFNSPDVYLNLLTIPNLEVRVSETPGFHAKGYLFKKEDYYSLIVGSSNLTGNAVKVNYEWNMLLTSLESGDVVQQTINFMEEEWSKAIPISYNWLKEFKDNYVPTIQQQIENISKKPTTATNTKNILPNEMQKKALSNLKGMRDDGAKKGLVISATGTGKTYLAAFDVQQFKPNRCLFIVHREQILNKAKEAFYEVVGGNKNEFAILSGKEKNTEAKYIFSTIQTISKEKYLSRFSPDDFDYILIDEVHKAGAQSYKKVIEYFDPIFLLGMTATPERTDGFNIFELFDYNIAYEIRLQEAMEQEMLTPFQYFGVTDYIKDNQMITETSNLNDLVSDERVDFLLEKIRYYGCEGNNPKGLVFCSKKSELAVLAKKFTDNGFSSTYLTGEHSIEEREKVVEQLERGEINYIFTVDIFNEGIDIPAVNQIIMLRNTQSNIIFIQQLGRGLRKYKGKNFVTVIDFIGNYKNNYMIPMSLADDTTRNKNALRRETLESNCLSGVSSIHFEKIAKEKIFESINQASLDSMKELKAIFMTLKNRIGRTPYLWDFQNNNMLDPLVIANKYNNYYEFLKKVKENIGELDAVQCRYLTIGSREFLAGKRKHELIILKLLLNNQCLSIDRLIEEFQKEGIANDKVTLESVFRVLDLSFFTGGTAKTYDGAAFIERDTSHVYLAQELSNCLTNDYFSFLYQDILRTGLEKSQLYVADQPLTLYQKYSRKDVMKLLNWPSQLVDQNVGGYTSNNKKFIIFVTLEKGDDFKGSQMAYADAFIHQSGMKLYSKINRSMDSPEIKIFQNSDDWEFYLFVKKSDDEGTDFYYLGQVEPIKNSITQLKKPTKDGSLKNVVEYEVHLKQEVNVELYRYLISGNGLDA